MRIVLPFCSIGGFDSTLCTALSAASAEPIVVAANPAMDDHLVGAAGLDGDIARAGGEIEVHRSGDLQSAIELPFSARKQQHGNQQDR